MANDNKRSDGSLSEETSAFGQRVKGAVKDGAGVVTGNESLEREGERENAEGRDRQRRNEVFDGSTPGSANASIREETGAFGERMKAPQRMPLARCSATSGSSAKVSTEADPLIAIAGGGGVNLYKSMANAWTADYLV